MEKHELVGTRPCKRHASNTTERRGRRSSFVQYWGLHCTSSLPSASAFRHEQSGMQHAGENHDSNAHTRHLATTLARFLGLVIRGTWNGIIPRQDTGWPMRYRYGVL